jgi:hypothetical protein
MATQPTAVTDGRTASQGSCSPAWLLFKTQLDNLDGAVRGLADLAWAGSRRIREWRGGDVRAVYYGVLAAVVLGRYRPGAD